MFFFPLDVHRFRTGGSVTTESASTLGGRGVTNTPIGSISSILSKLNWLLSWIPCTCRCWYRIGGSPFSSTASFTPLRFLCDGPRLSLPFPFVLFFSCFFCHFLLPVFLFFFLSFYLLFFGHYYWNVLSWLINKLGFKPTQYLLLLFS